MPFRINCGENLRKMVAFINRNIECFNSRDLYTKINYFEGVATQENNNLDSKQLFASCFLTVALLCDHTSMQRFTTTNKDKCALP